MEISRVTYTTYAGDKEILLPTHDPDVIDSIFGSQQSRIISIEPLDAIQAGIATFGMREPNLREICDLFQALSQLFSLGVDPVGSLNMLIRRIKNIHLSYRLLEISQAIQQGEPIADAFEMHSRLFGETSICLIRTGAATGNLGQAFERLAHNMTKARSIASKVQSALVYPAAVLVVVYIVVLIFCFVVIPRLANIYEQLGGTLPIITQGLQSLSNLLRAYPLLTLLLPTLGYIAFRYREKIGRSHVFSKLMRKLPGIRDFVWKKNLTQACSTLSLLLESGLPLTDSLEFSSKVVSDVEMAQIFLDIRDRLEQGELVSEAFGGYATELGPDGHRLIMAVEVGDATGSLAPLVGKLAKTMEEEFDIAAQNLNRLLEPAVIVVLTFVVGVLVYAIYYPIFTIGQQMINASRVGR